MKNVDYAQSVILARVYEKRLLGKSKLDRMIDAVNAEEAYKILMDSEYSKSATNISGVYSYVELLNHEMVRVRNLAKELLKDDTLFEIMNLKYEYHNLKIIAKNRYSDKDLTEKFIPSKVSNPNLLLAQVKADKYVNMKKEYANALKEAFQEYEKSKDPQIIDIVLDRHYFMHMTQLLIKTNNTYYIDYIKAEIDFYNLDCLIRMQRMGKNIYFAEKVLVDNGSIEKSKLLRLLQADIDKIISTFKMEKIGDYVKSALEYFKKNNSLLKLDQLKKKYLSDLNKNARFITFGPEPVISYLLTKEDEIDKVRFILIAKLNNISPEIIRERLGDRIV